jgi:nitrogen fixation protein
VGGKLRVNFVMLNSYFDDKDFEEPIKKYMKNYVAETKFNTS